MPPLHERFLTAMADERLRSTTRRRFVARGALAGGALALAGAGSAILAAQQEFADDVDVLNYALTLEHLAAAFYREGLKAFDEAAFQAANRPETVRPDLEAIRDHEQTHVKELTAAIADQGGTPVEPARYDFALEDVDGFLQLAAELAATAVAAYAGALPSVADKGVLATLLGIHSVEARHASYLNARVEVSPFPDAIDAPLSREQATAALDDLVAGEGGPAATAEASPAAEAPAAQTPAAETPVSPAAIQDIPIEGSRGGRPPADEPPADEEPSRDEPDVEAPADEEPRSGNAKTERFAAVVADAAAQIGVSPDEVEIVQTEKTEWPDSSLGCPEPDGVYAQVITPGFVVIVAAAGTQIEYHTDRQGNFVLCS